MRLPFFRLHPSSRPAIFAADDEPPPLRTERLTAACILSAIGGFLDIYTYLFRGGVFANAVTGNMVLFGLTLADTRWNAGGKYLLAIFSYALGVFAAEEIRGRFPAVRTVVWQQTVLILEATVLLPVIFIPEGEWDFAVNAAVSFVCALQVQTFRRVHGLPFASTMCTGNLRSGTEAVFRSLRGGSFADFRNGLRYYGVIACFIAGAGGGALLLRGFGPAAFLLAPAGLFTVLLLVLTERQGARLRRLLPGGRRRRRGKTGLSDCPR